MVTILEYRTNSMFSKVYDIWAGEVTQLVKVFTCKSDHLSSVFGTHDGKRNGFCRLSSDCHTSSALSLTPIIIRLKIDSVRYKSSNFELFNLGKLSCIAMKLFPRMLCASFILIWNLTNWPTQELMGKGWLHCS